MSINKEILLQSDTETSLLLRHEPGNVQRFYDLLSAPGTVISWEFMREHAAPEWSSFTPVVADGHVVAYTRPGLVLEASRSPWLIMPDSLSAGGKTVLAKALIKYCQDYTQIIRTCTTRPLQDDERISLTWQTLLTDPLIRAGVSSQYLHISEEDFRSLEKLGFFVERRQMWETGKLKLGPLYGIPRSSIEQAKEGKSAFSLLLVDEVGQQKVIEWMGGHNHHHIRVQKWFLLPTDTMFETLKRRISSYRSNPAPRIVDGVRDLYWGANRADVIIANPFNPTGIPEEAIKNCEAVMKILRPDVMS